MGLYGTTYIAALTIYYLIEWYTDGVYTVIKNNMQCSSEPRVSPGMRPVIHHVGRPILWSMLVYSTYMVLHWHYARAIVIYLEIDNIIIIIIHLHDCNMSHNIADL